MKKTILLLLITIIINCANGTNDTVDSMKKNSVSQTDESETQTDDVVEETDDDVVEETDDEVVEEETNFYTFTVNCNIRDFFYEIIFTPVFTKDTEEALTEQEAKNALAAFRSESFSELEENREDYPGYSFAQCSSSKSIIEED